jgi:hypothetical protein
MMETTREITFSTYNVWSREDMVVRLRMEAIGELVRRHKPDVIFFQVTFRKKNHFIRSLLPRWFTLAGSVIFVTSKSCRR